MQNCMGCGPTIVVQREHKGGEHIACPSCTGKYLINVQQGEAMVTMTGELASAKELQPKPDTGLIARFVEQSVATLFSSSKATLA